MGSLTQFVLALALAVAAPSPQAATPPPDPQALERQAKHIETLIIAPCCWSQQVSLHQSPASDDIKKNIRVMLAAGKTEQQILDSYVAEFGDRVMAEPPARGFNAALYVAPWIFLAGSIGLVVLVIKRLRTPGLAGAAESPRAAAPVNDDEAERIDEELRRLD